MADINTHNMHLYPNLSMVNMQWLKYQLDTFVILDYYIIIYCIIKCYRMLA